MPKIVYRLPDDHASLPSRLGFDRPIRGLMNGFEQSNVVPRTYPQTRMTKAFEHFSVPQIVHPGGVVPVIFAQSGYTNFEVARWGVESRDGALRIYHAWEDAIIGNPCLIPASFIDIEGRSGEDERDRTPWVRIRGGMIGGIIVPGSMGTTGEMASVAILVRHAQRMESILEWEPLFPDKSLEFLQRQHTGRRDKYAKDWVRAELLQTESRECTT